MPLVTTAGTGVAGALPLPSAAAPPPPPGSVQTGTGNLSTFGVRAQQQATDQASSQQVPGQQGPPSQQQIAPQSKVQATAQALEVQPTKGILADMKGVFGIQWAILRGERVVAQNVILDHGESIRLRIDTREAGRLSVAEGEKVLATAEVEAGKPFDTPPLPFDGSGARLLRVLFTPATSKDPITVPLILNYR